MIDNDDMLHRVDRTYLGPTGFTFPVRLRYAAIGLGGSILVTVFVIARGIVHVPLGFKSLVVILALTVVATARITKYVNADRPVRSIFRAAWNDLVAPRPQARANRRAPRVPHRSRHTWCKHLHIAHEGDDPMTSQQPENEIAALFDPNFDEPEPAVLPRRAAALLGSSDGSKPVTDGRRFAIGARACLVTSHRRSHRAWRTIGRYGVAHRWP